jgi:hypothetical protein
MATDWALYRLGWGHIEDTFTLDIYWYEDTFIAQQAGDRLVYWYEDAFIAQQAGDRLVHSTRVRVTHPQAGDRMRVAHPLAGEDAGGSQQAGDSPASRWQDVD